MKYPKLFMSSLLLAMLLAPFIVSAQQPTGAPKVARKFDEYTYGPDSERRVENDCDVDAHLDNFAYYLRAELGSRGYMISYRGKRKRSKYFAYDPDWQFEHLTSEWKFEEGSIVLVDGGVREKAMMELWIVPEGAEAPKSRPTVLPGKRKKGE